MKNLLLGISALVACGFGGIAPDRQYVFVDMDKGERQREFVVTAKKVGEDIVLSGDAKDDYVLSQGPKGLVVAYDKNVTPVEARIVGTVTILSTKDDGDFIHVLPYDPPSAIAPTKEWFSPYADKDRRSFSTLYKRVGSEFGAHRNSPKPGHIHAGWDLRGKYNEEVYAPAAGRVEFVSHWDENGMVLIKHFLEKGGAIYTKLVHLKDIKVTAGQLVTEQTVLGRLFDEKEFKASGHDLNHVHLEVRKNYDDKGRASSRSRTLASLKKHCFVPHQFFHERLKR